MCSIAQAVSKAEGASRRLTAARKELDQRVPLGPEEHSSWLADVSVPGARHDAVIYTPIAAGGRLKSHQEQK